MIFGFWHNTQVFLSYHHRGEPINIMVSQSKDGEYIAQVMDWMNITAIRGSSSRGGLRAFVEILQRAEAGEQIGFTPDGPKGPAHSVQDGIVVAAKRAKIPIVPLHTISRRRLVFNTWDKFMIPLPFSHIIVSHGKPFLLHEDVPEEEAKEKVRTLLDGNEEVCVQALETAPSYIESFSALVLIGIYNVLLHLLAPIWLPIIFLRYGFKRSMAGMSERLGFAKPGSQAEKRFWFHAASLGEWQALAPFLEQMKKKEKGAYLVTTSAPEARDLIRREHPELTVHLLPMDLPWIIGPWISRWQPQAIFVMETELWPNLIEAAYRKYIPLFVINGRLSEKGLRGWAWARPLGRRLMRRVSHFFVRTETDARCYKLLGAPEGRVSVVGNLKVDNLRVLSPEEKTAARRKLWEDVSGTIVVAGSTWGEEEKLVLKLLAQPGCEKIRLVIAPRRRERFEEVAGLLQSQNFSFDRWSKIKDTGLWKSQILLVDTLGDLKRMYEAADIAFIGGSFEKRGGQNPLEAAAAGNALVFGASMGNFEKEADQLVRAEAAFQERDEIGLLSALQKLVTDVLMRRRMGEEASRVVLDSQGVAARVLSALQEKMEILK